MKLLGGRYQLLRDVIRVGQVAVIVGVLYVMAVAPHRVLTGRAERNLDYVAGFAGLLVWAYMVYTVGKIDGTL